MGLMALASIVLGIAPQLAVNYLLNPVLSALSLGAGLQVTWLGLFAGAGSFSTAGGLVLALISLVLGGVIYSVAYSARSVTLGAAIVGAGTGNATLGAGSGDIFTGGEPLLDRGRLTASDFSEIFAHNWNGFFHWSNVDRVYLVIWNGMQAASRGLGAAVAWMENRATVLVTLAAAIVFVLLRWIVSGIPGSYETAATPISPLLIAACFVAAITLVLAALAYASTRGRAPLMLLICTSTLAGLLLTQPRLRLALLEFGALLTVRLVWQTARTQRAKFTYLVVFLLSALSMAASELLTGPADRSWQQALMLTSICIKLGAVPMFFWLLSLADELPAPVLGLIIAVVDMAAFGEFATVTLSINSPSASQPLLIAAAVLTSLLAALLMLTQRSLKRLLVLSTVEDVGFLLLGVGSMQLLGREGAWIAAATHAMAKALLFTCLSGPESEGALQGAPTGLVSRYPFSAFGFLFGMIAMLGIPPTLGFIGRWRLYESALRISPLLMTAFLLASVMALIAYLLALTRVWWGPAGAEDSASSQLRVKEPLILKSTIVALVLLLLAAGLCPQMLQLLAGGRP
jgi:formate hydrogenlyase subunit 3/multisubunit Na+/H+ antiporter MnhD subunit